MERHIGIVLPSLGGGGAERATLTLAGALIERGCRVDIVLLRFSGTYRATIPSGLRLYYRRVGRNSRSLLDYCHHRGIEVTQLAFDTLASIRTLPSLCQVFSLTGFSWSKTQGTHDVASYLRQARPDLLFSALPRANVASVLAADLMGQSMPVPVVASIRNNVGLSYSKRDQAIARRLMPRAGALVAVSKGIAADTAKTLDIAPNRIRPIYNPQRLEDIHRLAEIEPAHPWFCDGGAPIILSILREAPQKDWETLTIAFCHVRRTVNTRLAILGRLSNEYQSQLLALARKLGGADDITFLGFDENPHCYMSRAALFVLSSRWEGLPNVLIESLACGTPVVSADAPYGPAEILENGRWGRLVPVGNAKALAIAIRDSLTGDNVPAELLRGRARDFSTERSLEAYESLFDLLLNKQLVSTIKQGTARAKTNSRSIAPRRIRR